MRDQLSVDAAVTEAIEQLGGGLDVLINCAGLATPQSAGEAPDARALAVIDVNLDRAVARDQRRAAGTARQPRPRRQRRLRDGVCGDAVCARPMR